MIPGQNPNDAGQGKPLELQLPVARNMDQLDQLKRDAMNAPQVAGKKNDPNAPQGGVVSVVPAPLPPRGDEDNRVSTPQSMHNHLADPFDILR